MKIIFFFTILITLSCSKQNTKRRILINNSIGKSSQCDTNFVNVIVAIEKDSFRLFDNQTYYHHLIKCEEDSCENSINDKYVFVSEFHTHIKAKNDWKSDELDTIFDVKDFENYQNQDLKILTKCYPQFNFVSPDTVKAWFEPEYRWPQDLLWFYSFSKPIVSKDRKYMLIEMSGMCGGLCGGFNTFVLENIASGWIVKRQIPGGVY